ncbi:MAG: CBS domain-containing protein [Candidatus Bathyarchaeota archaeon]|nr:CBS domain-containing protein [Candidatus Termiticorpusculum sp.]
MESNILVRDVMTKNPRIVREDTSIREVVATFSKYDINSIIVIQNDNPEKPVGIVTARDALIRGFEYGLPVGAITAQMVASSPIITIDEQVTVEQAAEVMRRNKIKHLPITSNNRLVGILTGTDILFAVPSMLSMMEEICHQK